MKVSLAALAILALSGCMSSTPPGASFVGGTLEEGAYTFLKWDEGLTIMIWDDITGSHSNHGSGSSSDPVFRGSGQADSLDGRSYSYQVETEDGIAASFTIDGKDFDLSQGTLFLVKTRGAETSVRQLSRDLSGVSFTNDALREFGQSDPDIAALISDGGGQ